MKTFSDTNSTIQQERKKDAQMVRRVELLRQFSGAITERVSATQIKVSGDATGLLAEDDVFIIPLYAFTTEHIVTSISFSAGETTITCSASSFAASGLVGLDIAKKHVVSHGNTERLIEMSNIRFEQEGETLNEWNASEVDLSFDNGDGYFANTGATGIFDNDDIFWVRIYFGYKGASDRLLYFVGLVDRDQILDSRYEKKFDITCYGHLKELERYPAWLLSEPNGDFLKLSGVEIASIVANDATTEGIKKLDWKFTEKSLLGVEILSITSQGNFGIVPLQFRFPNLFKYAWGDWTEVAENTASADLTGADGSVLAIKTTNYDVRDAEVFLNIVADLKPRVDKSGIFQLQFDNGQPVNIGSDFAGVITDEGSTTFVDQSNANDRDGVTYEVLQASDAAIYIFANEPFYGVELFIDSSDLIGTIDLAFSSGFDSWTTIGSFADGTSDFGQDGEISWTKAAVAGWRPMTFEPDPGITRITQKFGLRIDLSAYTSGSATIKGLRRFLKVFAADGTELGFKIDFKKLIPETVKEDLIVRQISGTWTPCTWYRNITFQQLIQNIFSEAHYQSTDIDALKITEASPVLSIIGQAPVPFYKKRAKALLWDSGNSKLYLGIGNELWSVTETGDFTYIDALDNLNEDDYGLAEFSIRRLFIDGSDIFGAAWWDAYDDMVKHHGDYFASFYVRLFQASSSAITTVKKASGAGETGISEWLHPCEQTLRKGKDLGGDDRRLGLSSIGPVAAGENLMIPFPQVLRNWEEYATFVNDHVLYDVNGLLSDTITGAGTFYFGEEWGGGVDNKGHFFRSLANVYFVNDNQDRSLGSSQWLNLKWQLGQAGFLFYNSTDDFVVLKMNRPNGTTDTDHKIGKIGVGSAFTSIYDLSDSLKQPLCGFQDGRDLIFSMMVWDDDGSDASDCQIISLDLDTGTPTTLFDFGSDAAEAAQSITGDETVATILEMVFNSDENTIHGCLLNRETFEYHYFVYDIANDKLYSTQTGSGFTFDKHRQIKDFVLFNDEVYAVIVDKRYQTDSAYLIKAVFSAGMITLTQIATMDPTDWDHATAIATSDAIWGVTGKGLLWKYSTTFYPRIGYANLGDGDLREVLNQAVQPLNRVINSRPDRTIRIVERDNYDGTKALYEDTHIQALQPLQRWEHFYDRVEVSWKDPVTGQEGIEASGAAGWERRVLKIDNPLIQNRHLAAVVAAQYYDYFNSSRSTIEADLIPLIQLEEYDRVNLIMRQENTDIDRADYFKLTMLDYDYDSQTLAIKGVSL